MLFRSTQALYEGLRAMRNVTLYTPADPAARVGVVSFNIDGATSSETADYLDREGIAVRGGLHCAPGMHHVLGTLRNGAVRASPSWQNTIEDVEALLRAVSRYSASR